MNVKKIILGLSVVGIAVGYYLLPLIPQSRMTEVLTQDGGYVEQGYVIVSLRELLDDPYCAMFCFPSTDDTRFFNYGALIIESLLIALLISALVWRIVKR